MPRTYQLRIYTIAPGRLDEFVDGWKTGVAPLRESFGYSVEGSWTMNDENKFVWIVSYDGPEDWQSLYERYMASDGRKALDPDPARLIAKSESWLMTEVGRE